MGAVLKAADIHIHIHQLIIHQTLIAPYLVTESVLCKLLPTE